VKIGLVVAMLCVAPVLAGAEDTSELDYLRAWYALEVDDNPLAAKQAFDALLALDSLPAERRAMCTVGAARCAVALDDRTGAVTLYRQARRQAAGIAKLEKRIDEALKRIGRTAHSGTFRFHYKQGFRFKTGKVVDPREADVVFADCAGGISSIDLAASGGIVNLSETRWPRDANLEPQQLFDGLAGAFARNLDLKAEAEADSRTPDSNVFILRTRDGGWAKLAVIHRGDGHASWQKWLATIVYSYHPDRPEFGTLPADAAQATTQFYFNRRLIPTREELDARAQARQRQIEAIRKGGGTVPEHTTTREVLLNRKQFNDYEKATFSFYFGVRDDPGKRMVRNDWDLLYSHLGDGTDGFWVRMVSDDVSTITDLGKLTWTELGKIESIKDGKSEKASAVFEHMYLVHTRDTDADSHSLFRVAAIRPGVACHIEWATMRTNTLRFSPGLKLSKEGRAAIERLLRKLDHGGPAFEPR